MTICPLALAAGADKSSDEVELQVDKMVCPMCAGTVSDSLRALEGVGGVRVDLDNKLVFVERAPGEKPEVEQIQRSIASTGFPVLGSTVYAHTRTESMKRLEEVMPGTAWPSQPTSVHLCEPEGDMAPADYWLRVTIELKDVPLWQEKMTESELPVTVFMEGASCAGWPASVDAFTVYHTEGVFAVRNADVAVSPRGTLLLFRLHK